MDWNYFIQIQNVFFYGYLSMPLFFKYKKEISRSCLYFSLYRLLHQTIALWILYRMHQRYLLLTPLSTSPSSISILTQTTAHPNKWRLSLHRNSSWAHILVATMSQSCLYFHLQITFLVIIRWRVIHHHIQGTRSLQELLIKEGKILLKILRNLTILSKSSPPVTNSWTIYIFVWLAKTYKGTQNQ